MAYDNNLAEKVREYLSNFPEINVEEKKMFGGLGFMVNEKMCINISGEKLMCRYDPVLEEEITEKPGFEPMIMKGKAMKGYCYVHSDGFDKKNDFEYWLDLCLEYNHRAKSSKKK